MAKRKHHQSYSVEERLAAIQQVNCSEIQANALKDIEVNKSACVYFIYVYKWILKLFAFNLFNFRGTS